MLFCTNTHAQPGVWRRDKGYVNRVQTGDLRQAGDLRQTGDMRQTGDLKQTEDVRQET